MLFTDCLSMLQTIENGYPLNNVCHRLQHVMHDILPTKTITLCWIASYTGILGNEEADMSSKRASAQAAQVIRLQYTDWYPLVNEKIL